VITCRGGSITARLAAHVARELGSMGVAEPVVEMTSAEVDRGGGRETLALDGCSCACGSRLATAWGALLVAAVNLGELGVGSDDAELADPRALAARVASRLRREAAPSRPARPLRHGMSGAPAGGQAHTVEDYLLAMDALTSPIVECGALVTDAPTLASHVSDALGVSRAGRSVVLDEPAHRAVLVKPLPPRGG
jgi:uncharacterized metal-binding protein